MDPILKWNRFSLYETVTIVAYLHIQVLWSIITIYLDILFLSSTHMKVLYLLYYFFFSSAFGFYLPEENV